MSFSPCPDPVPGDADSVDAIETLIVPRAVDLGEMEVRRALPSTKRQMVGPFIFFDQMGPAEFLTDQGIDVRPHPHINLATVTYLFEGEIRHRDSLGTDIAINPGAVNWMMAGRGIVHSERTSEKRRQTGQKLFGIQTWVALPEDAEERDPDFIHHGAADLPIVTDHGVEARLIAGQWMGASSPLRTASETLYADVQIQNGQSVPIDPTYEERALYTIVGAIEIAGQSFGPNQLLVLRPGDSIKVTATSDARFMLFGGASMGGPRYIWWNFVSSRANRIEQAKEEWRQGRFGTVPGDEDDFIPLPENASKPRRATGGVIYP
ncbi:pirin family protein [Notoacmeibacter sp. MSK16QG-6]|uniref:pirin family protein n=1 Tax=Notoacmeibacter sp. MSK16QG-6 TaxID=2957982 RepID=UPI0020A0BC0B|nr:pirin family protein [Notoacmeibacter sp. MSK16QG-6]MCP1199430.1 pirin family protein [Notoacmeibacter sp. MSK16QG-6]